MKMDYAGMANDVFEGDLPLVISVRAARRRAAAKSGQRKVFNGSLSFSFLSKSGQPVDFVSPEGKQGPVTLKLEGNLNPKTLPGDIQFWVRRCFDHAEAIEVEEGDVRKRYQVIDKGLRVKLSPAAG